MQIRVPARLFPRLCERAARFGRSPIEETRAILYASFDIEYRPAKVQRGLPWRPSAPGASPVVGLSHVLVAELRRAAKARGWSVADEAAARLYPVLFGEKGVANADGGQPGAQR